MEIEHDKKGNLDLLQVRHIGGCSKGLDSGLLLPVVGMLLYLLAISDSMIVLILHLVTHLAKSCGVEVAQRFHGAHLPKQMKWPCFKRVFTCFNH